jgi:hypothetical protein
MTEPAQKLGWLAESLRATLIFKEPEPQPKGSWTRLLEYDPEEERRQPRAPLIHEEGKWGQGRLAIAATDVRQDLVYAAVANTTDPIDQPSLGAVDEAVKPFREIVDRWIFGCRPAHRVAIGLVLVIPVGNREEGYVEMSRFLPTVKIDAVNSRDFFYRINRPRRVSIAGSEIDINRLSTWGVAIRDTAKVQVEGGEKATSSVQTSPKPSSSVRVDIDINTGPDHEELFDSQKCIAIVGQLLELASEIAEKGDL